MPTIARTASRQSRVSNGLAMTVMLLIGMLFLVWYYRHLATRASRVPPSAQTVQSNIADRSHSEVPLPSLGNLESVTFTPAEQAQVMTAAPAAPTVLAPPPLAPPPHPSVLERRLSGVAFASSGIDQGAPVIPSRISAVPASQSQAPDGLAVMLKAQSAQAAAAQLLPTQRLLLPKGAFLDCTLETAIDSSLPGLTTCVTATDTFGADGTVVLLERGTKLVGETQAQVQHSASRVFVLWTEARTPTGVVVPLDSPGADELGRSGLPGEVERHFWQRFGAAILISTVDGAVQAAVQSASKGNGAVIYNPSGAQDVMSEVLKSTLNTPPTIVKANGDRIQILVARNVDFSNVYELRHAIDRP